MSTRAKRLADHVLPHCCVRDIGPGYKMAAELEPPFSLQSMNSTGSSDQDMDLVADEEDEEREHQGVFVLREKRGVIYPLDYKYRVGKF